MGAKQPLRSEVVQEILNKPMVVRCGVFSITGNSSITAGCLSERLVEFSCSYVEFNLEN